MPRRAHVRNPLMRGWYLLFVVLTAAAAPSSDVPVYGRFDQTVQVSRPYSDPLREVQARVEFKSPSGQKHVISAFWNGGHTWRVRFSPEEKGRWEYRWESNNNEMPREAGTFRVVASAGGLAGAPRLSKDRRYFIDAAGRPWFFLSDTAWNGALLSTREEWDEYLTARSRQRFTAVQFVMTQWRAGRKDENGRVAFSVEGERLLIDPEFFARMDDKIAAVNRHGLVAAPVLLWALTSKDNESPGEALSISQAILLARYMAARYGAFQVIWILGGDGDYRGEKAAKWREIGRGVFPPEEDRRLVTLHPRGMQSPWPDLKDEPWVDFFMYQSGHGDSARKWRWQVTEGAAKDWRLEPVHPVLDGEPNYEGHLAYESQKVVTDFAVRRAAYYSLLAAPVAGVAYGAHGIWFWSRKPEVPLDHPKTGVALPWKECVAYPGGRQMTVMRDIFDRMEWWKLRPDRTLLAEDKPDEGFTDYVMAARAQDGSSALFYTPVKQDLKVTWSGGSANWIDPKTGAMKPVRMSDTMTPPGDGDWLLWVQR